MNSLADTLRNIDYHSLTISNYSRNYILRMLPAIDYYLAIYERCLDHLLASNPELTLVDYGGGHGFFSLAAKRRGVKNVIYIDHNAQAKEAAQAVASIVGISADTYLCGDEQTLAEWCRDQRCKIDVLAGMDVIEHIHRLVPFFDTLMELNRNMKMVFTTGSNPKNPFIRRKLRRVMINDENLFVEQRRQYIAENHPEIEDTRSWADASRGLTFADIDRLIDSHCSLEVAKTESITLCRDIYNTCDPTNGSWTERILPLNEYKDILWKYHVPIHVERGFYNTRRGGIKGLASSILNAILQVPGTIALAPFIILKINYR